MFSVHLADVPAATGARALARAPRGIPGLRHVEVLAQMRLGAPVLSPDRLQVSRLAVFARWDGEAALDDFLGDDPGATLALAAVRPPRTFSTFTVWRSSRAMTDMVFGRPRPGESREAQCAGTSRRWPSGSGATSTTSPRRCASGRSRARSVGGPR